MDSPEYTAREYSNMLLCYGEADCDANLALQIYKEKHRKDRHPSNSKVITDAFDRLRNNLRLVPSSNVISESSEESDTENIPVNVYKCKYVRPFSINSQVKYAEWLLEKQRGNGIFVHNVLWTDDSVFTPKGMFNRHKSYKANFESEPVEDWTLHVWAGVLNNQLHGPYFLPKTLNNKAYCAFIKEIIPNITEDIPLKLANKLWFAHDTAKWHECAKVSACLEEFFSDQWIGPCGVMQFPENSPELMPVQFVWDYVIERVFNDLCVCEEEMQDKIVEAFEALKKSCQEDPQLMPHVLEETVTKCYECVRKSRRYSESD